MERVVRDWDEARPAARAARPRRPRRRLRHLRQLRHRPAPRERADGPDELHLVIVDNGRSSLLGTELDETLDCIRCGACLNACPVYRQIGGHAYGGVYSGPDRRGAHARCCEDSAPPSDELPGASSLCGACMEACPVGDPAAGPAAGRPSEPRRGRSHALARLGPRLVEPARLRPLRRSRRPAPPQALVPPPFRNWAKGRELPPAKEPPSAPAGGAERSSTNPRPT